jgi:Zn finger protein HypA/HybF involved in hydrogenase expression
LISIKKKVMMWCEACEEGFEEEDALIEGEGTLCPWCGAGLNPVDGEKQ